MLDRLNFKGLRGYDERTLSDLHHHTAVDLRCPNVRVQKIDSLNRIVYSIFILEYIAIDGGVDVWQILTFHFSLLSQSWSPFLYRFHLSCSFIPHGCFLKIFCSWLQSLLLLLTISLLTIEQDHYWDWLGQLDHNWSSCFRYQYWYHINVWKPKNKL